MAFPSDYGNSGIKTFVVSHQGTVFEKDLGKNTFDIAGRMDEYDLDETWNDTRD